MQERATTLVARRESAARLEHVRPRLQHYIKAMYGDAWPIESLPEPGKTNLAVRALRAVAFVKEKGASVSDAHAIRLPTTLPGQRTNVSPLEQYRLLAVQHAERMHRASAIYAREATTDLERDLYQLVEAATIDAHIATSQPGLASALRAARAEAITRRPKPRWRSEIELCVEDMFRRAWPSADGMGNGSGEMPAMPLDGDAESNATWARRTAAALEARFGRRAAREYRRVPEITLWDTTVQAQLPEDTEVAIESELREQASAPPPDVKNAKSRSQMPGPSTSKSSQNKQGSTPGDSGNRRASSRSESDNSTGEGDDGSSSATQTPDVNAASDGTGSEAGSVLPDGASGEDGQARVGHSGKTVDDDRLTEGVTYHYPEWDFNVQGFRTTCTTVRVVPSPNASASWATSALLQHAQEVHRARRQFERLRSHRLRLKRQLQGDELDLEACVEALVDRRMGVAPSDRLYSHVQPGRRELAITLLIDVSGSTGDTVAGEQRVIDIERIAALVATAAFDALGDDYSILAFSSASATNVRVHTLKDFGERNSTTVLERISALSPHGTTRLGAAVRHATAQLSNHPAPHRLLLILSDGKPFDYDWYFVDYAIQDSRQAVMNARLQGIHPFCITVDAAEGETYLSEIFGSTGYRVVSKPSQLSQALLLAVQRMIGGSA
jgi:nitric oxide reductase NorD protein